MSDLLPKNSTQLEKKLSSTLALSNISVPIRDIWNPDTCREDMLPWLAWGFYVDEWRDNWTEQQKRDAIKASLNVHKHKGTIGAVKAALAALGFSVQVQEWFNQIPDGEPYTFKLLIAVDQVGFDFDELKKIQKVVNSAKNIRSHMAKIEPIINSMASGYAGAIVCMGNEITVKNEPSVIVINEVSVIV